MSNKYINPSSITKDDFLEVIAGSDTSLMCQAIVNATDSISDYDWLLHQFSLLTRHQNLEVRGVTISCIGHLARLNKNANKDQLLGILQPLLSDVEIVGRVEDAVDDVRTYL